MRYAIYARYSDDSQNPRSIEDQIRVCHERAGTLGGTVAATYTDPAISGASMVNRPGVQALVKDARAGRFDVVITEDLDRISRSLADTAWLYDRLTHLGISLVTLPDGQIDEMKAAFKGLMSSRFLKDLADKTRRGQRGSAENGLFPGGLTYGYSAVNEVGAEGKRVINEDQRSIVIRIFTEYAGGKSARDIALGLNRDGIPGPRGGSWSSTTISGHHKRHTGFLHNEIYIGRLVWNRQRFVKDPDTGKRIARMNAEKDWTITEVPELRIVPDDLWNRAQAVRRKHGLQNGVIVRRPKRLLSGLLVCSVCSGPLSMIRGDHVGCSNHKYKGTCPNGRLTSMTEIEERVLARMKENLLDPEMVAQIVREVEQTLRQQDQDRGRRRGMLERDIAKTSAEIERLVTAITRGLDTPAMASRLRALEDSKAAMLREMDVEPPRNIVRLLPNLADGWKKLVEEMQRRLSKPDRAGEAATLMREMIERVVVIPKPERGQVTLRVRGRLGELLGLVAEESRERMVAGARYQPLPTTKVWEFEC